MNQIRIAQLSIFNRSLDIVMPQDTSQSSRKKFLLLLYPTSLPAGHFLPPSATTTSRSSPVLSSSLHQAPVHLSRRCPVAEASTCTPARNRGSSRQLLQPLHPCAVTLLKLKMSSSSSDGKLPIPLLLPSCKAAIPLPACSLVLLCSVHSCCSGSSAALLVCFLHLLGPAVCSSSRWCAMLYMCRDSTPACSGGSVDECS